MDELGSEVKRLKDAGVPKPFPFSDLAKFRPPWATAVLDPHKCIPFVVWAASFHRWAIAVECTGLARLTACHAHFDNCLRAGELARAAGRSPHVASAYDEVVRRKISDLAHAGMHNFDVDSELRKFDTDAVASAEVNISIKFNKSQQAATTPRSYANASASAWMSQHPRSPRRDNNSSNHQGGGWKELNAREGGGSGSYGSKRKSTTDAASYNAGGGGGSGSYGGKKKRAW